MFSDIYFYLVFPIVIGGLLYNLHRQGRLKNSPYLPVYITPLLLSMGLAVKAVHVSHYDATMTSLKDYGTVKTQDAEHTGYITKNPLMGYVEVLQVPKDAMPLNCNELQEYKICQTKPIAVRKSNISEIVVKNK